jgi:hypothetical protein
MPVGDSARGILGRTRKRAANAYYEASNRGAIDRLWMHADRSRPVYEAIADLLQRHEANGHVIPNDLTRFEARVMSQNGEDGVIAELLRRLNIFEPGFFVEFGIESGAEGNSVFLADLLGWRGLFLEPDDASFANLQRKYGGNPRVTTAQEAVTAENVEALFDAYEVPLEPDLLSIDVDGNDYWIWKAVDRHRPKLVIIEYNGGLPLDRRLVMPYDPDWRWSFGGPYGASLGAMFQLAAEKGYRPAHTELAGVNAFFVRDDLDIELPAPESVPRRGANHKLLAADHPSLLSDGPAYLDLDATG